LRPAINAEKVKPSWIENIKDIPQYVSITSFSNGLLAWLFGVTGPLLIVLNAAAQGDLPDEVTISWVFSIYFIGGLLTILLSLLYRQPIAFAFSIPGAVLVGTTLSIHSLNDVIGVYIITGVLILFLGLSGTIEKMMRFLPMPIMMGMVSGVLLPFGIGIITAISDNVILNGVIFISFLIFSISSGLLKNIPPIVGTMIVAAIFVTLFGELTSAPLNFSVAKPMFIPPSLDIGAISELAIPLLLTVIAIQNAQGIGVMKSLDYEPPINAMTNWSGIGSIINGIFGAHSACVAGPMTAILAQKETGPKEGRYVAALLMGLLWMVFGILAPFAITITKVIPNSLILLLGGLALIGVLKNCLVMSFSQSFKMGALFSFIITVSDVSFFNIGAPFWALVGGALVSLFLEKKDFSSLKAK
jgi:benzoate membrane transport protein